MATVGRHRKIAREIAFRTLYSYDFRPEDDIFEILEDHIRDVRNKIPQKALEYVYKILDTYIDNSDKVDEIIEEHLERWTLKRLGYPERAFLRLGTTELVFSDLEDKGRVFVDILDLIDCYIGTEDSLRFINGVLSSIYKKYGGTEKEVEKVLGEIDIDEFIEKLEKLKESSEEINE